MIQKVDAERVCGWCEFFDPDVTREYRGVNTDGWCASFNERTRFSNQGIRKDAADCKKWRGSESLAYVCDRCGSARPAIDIDEIWARQTVRLMSHSGQEIELDLCDDCVKALREFIESLGRYTSTLCWPIVAE